MIQNSGSHVEPKFPVVFAWARLGTSLCWTQASSSLPCRSSGYVVGSAEFRIRFSAMVPSRPISRSVSDSSQPKVKVKITLDCLP